MKLYRAEIVEGQEILQPGDYLLWDGADRPEMHLRLLHRIEVRRLVELLRGAASEVEA